MDPTLVVQHFNITILPMIIIPVTGLCCLVFYNRITALTGNLHVAQRELRQILLQPAAEAEKSKQLIKALREEERLLHSKANLIRTAIVFCFSGIISFVLSALSIMLELFWSDLVFVTFSLWVIGALCFATGLAIGISEIASPKLRSMQLESDLIEEWMKGI